MSLSAPLLQIDQLSVSFGGHAAVRPLDLTIARGEILALVGESGSGKSTVALATMGLLPGRAQVQGAIRFEEKPLFTQSEREWSALRGNRIGMIFQEPMTSLNPLQPIGRQVAEALTLHRPMSAQAAHKEARELLELVRLPEAQRRFGHYPHQLSGGQRQRVMIAIAVACRPGLLIADEPTTALDVTIQAQILELLDRLRRELSMAVLLITHDLGRPRASGYRRVCPAAPCRRLRRSPICPIRRRDRPSAWRSGNSPSGCWTCGQVRSDGSVLHRRSWCSSSLWVVQAQKGGGG